jgi:hypothetical protein
MDGLLMNKSAYQQLRFAIEAEIYAAAIQAGTVSVTDTDSCVNNIMRTVISVFASEEVRRQRLRQQFLTFRRSPDVKAPSWAYRKPGIDSRLPKL